MISQEKEIKNWQMIFFKNFVLKKN